MVSGIPRGTSVKFNILNYMKPESLYNNGMQPLVYHELLAKKSKIGWFRGCYDICYHKNNFKCQKSKHKNLYTLSFMYIYNILFSYQFNSPSEDKVYFAYSYPYTYSHLQSFIKEITNDDSTSCYIRKQLLTKSIIGNTIDLLTITEPTDDIEDIRKRKGVFISARVHPGETVSSFIMEGLIRSLIIKDDPVSKVLIKILYI